MVGIVRASAALRRHRCHRGVYRVDPADVSVGIFLGGWLRDA